VLPLLATDGITPAIPRTWRGVKGQEMQKKKKIHFPGSCMETEMLLQNGAADGLTPLHAHILKGLRDILALLKGTRKEFYTVHEVAELTGRTPYTIRRWLAERRISATRVSGTGPRERLLIPRDQLERLIGSGLGAEIPNSVTE